MYPAFSFPNLFSFPQNLTSKLYSLIYWGKHEASIIGPSVRNAFRCDPGNLTPKKIALSLFSDYTLFFSSLGHTTSLGVAAETAMGLMLNGLALIVDSLNDSQIAPDITQNTLDWLRSPTDGASDFFEGLIWYLMIANFYMQFKNNKKKVDNLLKKFSKVESEAELFAYLENTLKLIHADMETLGINTKKLNDESLVSVANSLAEPIDLEYELRILLKQLNTDFKKLQDHRQTDEVALLNFTPANNMFEDSEFNTSFEDLEARIKELCEVISEVSLNSPKRKNFFHRYSEKFDKISLTLIDWIPSICAIPFFTMFLSFSAFDRTSEILSNLDLSILGPAIIVLVTLSVFIATGTLQSANFLDNLVTRSVSKRINFSKKVTFFAALLGIQSYVSNFLGETTTSLALLFTYFPKALSLILFGAASPVLAFIGVKSYFLTYRKGRICFHPADNQAINEALLVLLPDDFDTHIIKRIDEPNLYIIKRIPGDSNSALLGNKIRIVWMSDNKLCIHECKATDALLEQINAQEKVVIRNPEVINEIKEICRKSRESQIFLVSKKITKTVEFSAIIGKALINMGNFFGTVVGLLFAILNFITTYLATPGPMLNFGITLGIALTGILFGAIALVGTAFITYVRLSTAPTERDKAKIEINDDNAEEIIRQMQEEREPANVQTVMKTPLLSYLSRTPYSFFQCQPSSINNDDPESLFSIPDYVNSSNLEFV